MTIHCRQFQTGADVIASALDVRRRIMNAKFKPRPVQAVPERVIMLGRPSLVDQDHHVMTWRAYFERSKPSVKRVIKTVSDIFGVSVADIKGPSRVQHIVRARHIAYLLLHDLNKLSYPEVGRRLGGRDHTSVLHGYNSMQLLMSSCDAVRVAVEMCATATKLEMVDESIIRLVRSTIAVPPTRHRKKPRK